MLTLSKYKLYVKLPDYVAAYMRNRYGGSVLAFSPDTIYYFLMRKSITTNSHLQNPLSPACWSQKAVEYVRKNATDLFEGMTNLCLPSKADVERLQPVYMPSHVGWGMPWVPNENCQMNRQGTTDFVGAAKQEFWNELFFYIHENRYKKASNGSIVVGSRRSDPNLISEFMTNHCIDASLFDAVKRRYYIKLGTSYQIEK